MFSSAMTLGSMRTFLEQIKKIVKFSEIRELSVGTITTLLSGPIKFKAISPIYELGSDYATKELCAKFCKNRSLRLVVITVIHSLTRKRKLLFVIPRVMYLQKLKKNVEEKVTL